MRVTKLVMVVVFLALVAVVLPMPQAEATATTVNRTFTSLIGDGYITGTSTIYNTAWTATSGSVYGGFNFTLGGQDYIAGYYDIYRAFLYFDTSLIPSGAIITGANLSLWVYLNPYPKFNITIQNGQPSRPNYPTLQASDYNKAYYSGNGGSRNSTQNPCESLKR